jgi:hypothetical protein
MNIAIERKWGSSEIKKMKRESIVVEDILDADFIWITNEGVHEYREWNDDLPFFNLKNIFLPLMI